MYAHCLPNVGYCLKLIDNDYQMLEIISQSFDSDLSWLINMQHQLLVEPLLHLRKHLVNEV